MLLYEYPPKLNHHQKQLKALNDLNEHKKMQKNMYKNIILGCIILLIALFVKVIIIKVFIFALGIVNMLTAYLLYRYSMMSRDTNCYTYIYDDRIEHRQGSIYNKKYTDMIIYYDDIKKSYQTLKGKMVMELKPDYRSEITEDNFSKHQREDLKKGIVTINFQDTRAKLYLIENLYEEIKYPKKNYVKIEDEEDEDDLWDPLHKHGL